MNKWPRSSFIHLLSIFITAVVLLNLITNFTQPDTAAAQNAPTGTADQETNAEYLFQVAELPPEYSPPADADPAIIRARTVTVDFNQLIPTPSSQLTLNLFEDEIVTVTLERTVTNGDRGYTWIGKLDGDPYSLAILVVSADLVVGEITTGPNLYQIRYLTEELHTIRQIDPTVLPPEAPPIEWPVETEQQLPKSRELNADDGSQIDVLVAYTEKVRLDAGGTAAAEALIDSMVAYTNQSYLNSGINQQLNLVHTHEVSYSEGDSLQTDLHRIRGYDGYMEEVHSLRNVHHADLIALIVDGPREGICGIAGLMTVVSTDYAVSGFSVTADLCGGRTFAHELGHNMGAHHDRYVTAYPGAYAYSYGYISLPGQFRTIMAYYDECADNGVSCTSLPNWSNPDITYEGIPTGIPEGDPLAADNRKTLNNTAYAVANFRDSLASVNHITGTVTAESDGLPLSDITVIAYRQNSSGSWTTFSSATTDAGGQYDLAVFDGDSYLIQFRDFSNVYAREYYENVHYIDDATPIPVSAGDAIAPVDAALSLAGGFGGIVTAEDSGLPLSDIHVGIYRSDNDTWNYYDYIFNEDNGQYAFSGLPAGTYRARFYDLYGPYLTEYFSNAFSLTSANDIVVQPGVQTPSIDIALSIGGHITGTIRSEVSTEPLPDIRTRAYRYDPVDGSWDYLNGDYSDESGHYDIGDLPGGTYRVRFYDYAGNYLDEYYDDAADIDSATDIAVTVSEIVSDIDALLTPASHIAGTVTDQVSGDPLESILIYIYRYDDLSTSWSSLTYRFTDAEGQYDVGGLPSGIYRVRFWDYYDYDYLTEYYDNAESLSSATDISLAVGESALAIDASLAKASHITGTVTAEGSGAPLAGISVVPMRYSEDSGSWYSNISSVTDSSGNYDIGGLSARTYRILFLDTTGIYEVEYYDDAADVDSANDLIVSTGVTISGIDAALTSTLPQQCLLLEAGWNMISSNLDATHPDLLYLLAPVEDEMILIKNNQGEVYWPSLGIDEIGSWQSLAGYQIYMLNPTELCISGTAIDPAAAPITLDPGWSMVSYLPSDPLPAEQALAGITAELNLAKNGSGAVYWPGYGINQIGDMQPGSGYQLNLNGATTLTYADSNP